MTSKWSRSRGPCVSSHPARTLEFLTPDEIERMAKDLGSIVTYIEKLKELDTSNVEPMAQVLFDSDETATLRDKMPAVRIVDGHEGVADGTDGF